jgi:N-acetylglucosamine malate deacetylase 1
LNKKRSILVVAAHPDDEVLGCGGTMARLSEEGNDVYTLILGEGITARDEKRDRAGKEGEIGALKNQAKTANEMMGVRRLFAFDLPDNRFDTVPLLDIIKIIEAVNKDVRADVVFTHSAGDLNIDHQITLKAVLTAFRPLAKQRNREIYSFEVPSSTEWGFKGGNETFTPNCFWRLRRDHIESKCSALRAYTEEVNEYPHPRSCEALEALARFRGTICGNDYAEAFQILRIVK